MLNSLQTSQMFAVMFPVTYTSIIDLTIVPPWLPWQRPPF
jgi:hypothetical protein